MSERGKRILALACGHISEDSSANLSPSLVESIEGDESMPPTIDTYIKQNMDTLQPVLQPVPVEVESFCPESNEILPTPLHSIENIEVRI